jgi:hypothetical protein
VILCSIFISTSTGRLAESKSHDPALPDHGCALIKSQYRKYGPYYRRNENTLRFPSDSDTNPHPLIETGDYVVGFIIVRLSRHQPCNELRELFSTPLQSFS